MEATLVVCASALSIDQRNNGLSLFNILEEINSPSFPTIIPYMAFIALMSREPNEPNVVDDLVMSIDIAGEPVFKGGLNPADFQQRLYSRMIVDMQGIVVNKTGTMRVVLSRGEQDLGLWRIRVNNIGPQIQQK